MGVCLLDLRDFNPRSREGSDHADEWEVLDD